MTPQEAGSSVRERVTYEPIHRRRPLKLPGDARIAVWTIVNVENWSPLAAMPRAVLPPPMGQPLLPGWETGAGFDYELPTGHPPSEVTDGLRHFRPYVTFSHRLERRRNLRIFLGFRLDEVEQTDIRGTFGKNSFQESSTGVTGLPSSARGR